MDLLKNGLHINSTFRVLRNMKQGFTSEKCLLETILSGAMWPAKRIHECNEDYSPMCPRCGGAEETAFHCFWDCPANNDIEDEYITRTDTYKERATREQESHSCLWLRGLLPEGYIEVPPEDMPVNKADITRR